MNPRAEWRQRPLHDNGDDEQEIVTPTATVHEQERETWTGLYDANGNKLHRPREPIGYRIR